MGWDSNLIISAKNGDLLMVKECLANSEYVNAKNKYGETALIYASQNGHLEIVQCLIENGVNVNANKRTSNCRWTALIYVSNQGFFEIVKILVKNGADVNIRDENLRTALFWAKNDEIREFLRNAGAKE